MPEQIKIYITDVNGITGELAIDDSLLGNIDQELADDIASAVSWAVYGMIGNRKLREAVRRIEQDGFLQTRGLDG